MTLAVAELSFVFGSGVDELTEAVLPICVLLQTELLTLATRVIVADAPEATELKVTFRLLPEPPQVPPPVV